MKKKLILSTFSFFMLLGCRPDGDSDSQLTVVVGPSDQFVLPISMRTCKEQREGADTYGVSKPSVQFNRFVYQWNGSNALELMYVRLHFESPDITGGKFTCYLSDEDLRNTIAPHSVSISADDSTARTAGCAIRCGGLSFKETVQTSFVTGEATLFGVETTADGDLLPVTGRTDISIRYEKD